MGVRRTLSEDLVLCTKVMTVISVHGCQSGISEKLLEFATKFDMVVGNIFFKKDLEKFIAFKSNNSFVIDCAVAKKEVMKSVRDVNEGYTR